MSGDGARNPLLERLPLLAFCVLAVMSVGAFFITQKLKAAKPVVWHNPHPVPSTFDPVGGRICRQHGHRISYRSTRITISPTRSGRISVAVYPLSGGDRTATISGGRWMAANSTHRFVWQGRQQDGRIAPAGSYYFQLVLHALDDHVVDLTNVPVRLITSAHPAHGGCFPSAE